jgi:hypothetical protein
MVRKSGIYVPNASQLTKIKSHSLKNIIPPFMRSMNPAKAHKTLPPCSLRKTSNAIPQEQASHYSKRAS